MRQNNKYLEKVLDELSVYQKKLLDDAFELSPTQQANFDRLVDIRDWLREGYSDTQVLKMSKSVHKLQDRRCRELLTITYEIFGELRKSRNLDGIKYVHSEAFLEAAQKIREAAEEALNDPSLKDPYSVYATLMKEWRAMRREAANIEGAYEKKEVVDAQERKKPTKVLFVEVETPEDVARERAIEDINHETIDD